MPIFYDDLIDRFTELHLDIKKVLEGLPAEALDWVPGPDMNSIAVLVTHLTGSERYWIGVAENKPPERDRDAEFRTKGLSTKELLARVVSVNDFARQVMVSMSMKDLEAVRHSPRNDKAFSVGWCLIHALEHSSLHAGHLQMTRQLWEQRKPAL
jgi:hypothetical protein